MFSRVALNFSAIFMKFTSLDLQDYSILVLLQDDLFAQKSLNHHRFNKWYNIFRNSLSGQVR